MILKRIRLFVISTLTFVVICSCGNVTIPSGEIILDGPNTDYNAFTHAELSQYPAFIGRFIHFDKTRFILYSGIDCSTLPAEPVSELELLQLPRVVDIKNWILFHNADFGNEYWEIKPEKHELLSGNVQLKMIKYVNEKFRYGNYESVYVRLKGIPSKKGKYGHMNSYERKFVLTEFLEMRKKTSKDCN